MIAVWAWLPRMLPDMACLPAEGRTFAVAVPIPAADYMMAVVDMGVAVVVAVDTVAAEVPEPTAFERRNYRRTCHSDPGWLRN